MQKSDFMSKTSVSKEERRRNECVKVYTEKKEEGNKKNKEK